MADTWGNGTDPSTQFDEDWVSDPDFHNVLKVNDVNEDDDDKIALHVINNSNNDDARALKVEGKAEIVGDATVDGIITANSSIQGNNATLNLGTEEETAGVNISQVGQITNIAGKTILYGSIEIDHPADDEYRIDVNDVEGELYIANNVEAGNLHLGKPDSEGEADADVIVESPRLRVGTSGIDGKIDANGTAKLLLGSDALTNHVEIGRSQHFSTVKGPLFAEEHIQVGTGADGKVDASANNRDLKVGTDSTVTNNVVLSRTGKVTDVKGRLDAEEHIRVGTGANDGKVDASANNRELKIGTDTTGNVQLSRAGKTIDMFGQARMNSNAIILNNVATILTAGSIALIANAAGHGNGPSIDIYIGGAMVRYVDATAWL